MICDDSVTFYESFRDPGWATHLAKALDTSVDDPEQQGDLDGVKELLESV